MIPIIIVVVLLLCCGAYFAVRAFIKAPKKPKPAPVIAPPVVVRDMHRLKQKYIALCDNLGAGITGKQIPLRKGYQKLNEIIRFFVFEAVGIKVQNCTLADIEKLNMPSLYALMREYYKPEFAEISAGDIHEALRKTKEVIWHWR